ncbi:MULTISPECIES: hypothetical protein [unclassified Corynebacterium]|uniref:hypothetical protein n=1 Tax=unclassified Corynebacterium TaxID=2624378 RepID=UPI0034CD9B9B
MSKRRRPDDTNDLADQLQPLVDDDHFLTDLSAGKDPSDGSDELAALFMDLRNEVHQPLPPVPVVAPLEGAESAEGTGNAAGASVASLADRRKAKRPRPFVHGLIGAAAATLVIAGAGAVVYNTQGFGAQHDPQSVELAGKLDEIESRAASGDWEGAQSLLAEARKMLNLAEEKEADAEVKQDKARSSRVARPRPTETVTETLPPEQDAEANKPAPAPEPTTVTEKATQTVTVTVTETGLPNPLPAPVEPTEEPSASPEENDGELAPPQVQQ